MRVEVWRGRVGAAGEGQSTRVGLSRPNERRSGLSARAHRRRVTTSYLMLTPQRTYGARGSILYLLSLAGAGTFRLREASEWRKE